MPGPAPARRTVAAVLVVLCLATTVALHVTHPDALVTLLPSPDMHELHVDFDTFRASAVALVDGGDIYHTPAKLRNLNPPLLTVLLAPTALLDALAAYRVFVGLTLLMVVGAVLAVARELRLRPGVTTVEFGPGGPGTIRLRRFAVAEYPLVSEGIPGRTTTSLSVPRDRSPRPWLLRAEAAQGATVCR